MLVASSVDRRGAGVEIGRRRQRAGAGDGREEARFDRGEDCRRATGTYAAALYFPNVQLLVISGHYSAPQLMEPRLAGKQYRDTYMELSGTVTPDTKIFVQDMGEPGLSSRKQDNMYDTWTRAGKIVMFDGEQRQAEDVGRRIREGVCGGRRGIRADSGRAAGRSEEIVQLGIPTGRSAWLSGRARIADWWALVDSNH